MRNERNERALYLISVISDIEVVGLGIEDYDFTEFFVDRNGDYECYRVYGLNGKYRITER